MCRKMHTFVCRYYDATRMKRFVYLQCVMMLLVLGACTGGKDGQGGNDANNDMALPPVVVQQADVPDATQQDDAEDEEEDIISQMVDATFEDFLFAFTTNHKLQKRRSPEEVTILDVNNNEAVLEEFDLGEEFDFLRGEFYTILYPNTEDIERMKNSQDSLAYVDRIDLGAQRIRTYEFARLQDGWHFMRVHDHAYDQSVMGSFLEFYAQFSADEEFQLQNIAQPMRMTMYDPDEDDVIEGTIDAEQWPAFEVELPQGELTNIRMHQHYGKYRMVMQKCGMGNGLQEIFTFDHIGPQWRLVSYEN